MSWRRVFWPSIAAALACSAALELSHLALVVFVTVTTGLTVWALAWFRDSSNARIELERVSFREFLEVRIELRDKRKALLGTLQDRGKAKS